MTATTIRYRQTWRCETCSGSGMYHIYGDCKDCGGIGGGPVIERDARGRFLPWLSHTIEDEEES